MDQFMGLMRQLLPVLGTLAVTLGWATQETINTWIALILQIVGPLGIIGGVVWSVIANSKSSILQSAAKMPEVKSITITDPNLANAAKAADPQTDVKLGTP